MICGPEVMNKNVKSKAYHAEDNSGGSANSSALFDIAGMRWYQMKHYVLYSNIQPIINSIY